VARLDGTTIGIRATLTSNIAGFTSQIAHAGAPPFQLWVLPRRLPRDVLVGTSAVYFASINWIKVPAFAALGRVDAVFGSADDGGYWLIGLRRRPFLPRLSGPVRWSSAHALADTCALLGPRVRTVLLETLIDVDDGESLERWRRSGRGYFS